MLRERLTELKRLIARVEEIKALRRSLIGKYNNDFSPEADREIADTNKELRSAKDNLADFAVEHQQQFARAFDRLIDQLEEVDG